MPRRMTQIEGLVRIGPARVILESPYAGKSEWRMVAFFQRWLNRRYARRCVHDSLSRGEAPIASHLLYTQPGILLDDVPQKGGLWLSGLPGIDAGLAWRDVAEACVVYTDRGTSKGMEYGIAAARAAGIPVEMRSIETCHARRQFGDTMVCDPCNLRWDMNDLAPPRCRRVGNAG